MKIKKRWLVVYAILALLVAGGIYEHVGHDHDLWRLPMPGTYVNIDHRILHIFCSGKGAPTVVFLSGNGAPGYSWSNIQPEVATFTRACWYDRAGYGWSDVGPYPRDSRATATDLHRTLDSRYAPAPYVLVGHSLGGLDVRVYNGMYPSDVVGAVLVESAHEEEPLRAPKFMLGHSAPRWAWRPIDLVVRGAYKVGLVRLFAHRDPLPPFNKRTRDQVVRALRQQPKSIATLAADATGPDSYREAHDAGAMDSKPLVVLTRGKSFAPTGDTSVDRQVQDYEKVWRYELQPKLAKLSIRGRQIIVPNSGHDIPEEAPEAIVSAVRSVVDSVRADSVAKK